MDLMSLNGIKLVVTWLASPARILILTSDLGRYLQELEFCHGAFVHLALENQKHPLRTAPTFNAEANLFAPSKRNFITPFDISAVCPEADVSAGSLALYDFSDESKRHFSGGNCGEW